MKHLLSLKPLKVPAASLVIRLAVIIAMLLSVFGFSVIPAAAANAHVTISRVPDVSGFILNTGEVSTGTEHFWWDVTYTITPLTSPKKVVMTIEGPWVGIGDNGPLRYTRQWDFPPVLPGEPAVPDFNPESLIDTTVAAIPAPTPGFFTGVNVGGFPTSGSRLHVAGINLGAYSLNSGTGLFTLIDSPGTTVVAGQTVSTGVNYDDPLHLETAHPWLAPAGTPPGTYTATVYYYNTTQQSPEDFAGTTFNIEQPLQLFKYSDLSGNGVYYKGKVNADRNIGDTTIPATGLTAGFPATGASLLVSGVDVGAYTLAAGVFTVPALTNPLTTGEIISIYPGLATWDFSVTGPGGYAANVSTTPGGYAVLPNITEAGNYTFTETTLKAGWRNTDPPGAAPISKVVTIPSATVDPTNPVVYFGNQELGSLRIFKFSDKNVPPDGIYNGSDSPLTGWEFTIDCANPVYHNVLSTNGNGEIIIPNLVPGNYSVTETLKAGWTCTTAGGVGPVTKTVSAGTQAEYIFGNHRDLGTLTVYKFLDVKGDGGFTPADGDILLGNWTFEVTSANPVYASYGTTDSITGSFSKIDLDPGQYAVEESVPSGWTCTTPNPQSKAVTAGSNTEYWFGNQQIPNKVPASSNVSLFIMLACFSGAMALLGVWRTRKSSK